MGVDLDMKEIFEIFFEESSEGLDLMETGLLGLDLGAANLDVINDVFRSAHSIKGGAATFGFLEISGFTHEVETLLDQLRSGERQVTEETVETLLRSVDCLREMLDALKHDAEFDGAIAASVQQRIVGILESKPEKVEKRGKRNYQMTSWRIGFNPTPAFFSAGCDPQRIFEELRRLGTLDVECHVDSLKTLEEFDPGLCYLSWTLAFHCKHDKAAIEEVFAWVSDYCQIEIEAVQSAPASAAFRAASPVKKADTANESSSIRVGIDKVDTLLNLVGELVITQSQLRRCGDEYSPENLASLQGGLMELERYTRELQESAMCIRMLPINVSFSRFPRLVRDLSLKLGKKVELKFSGENTELDKNVLEKMSDPLVHLVRNSLDHGIETPEKRVAAGKPEAGVLHIGASQENGNIVIRVEDDGAGLNHVLIRKKAIERGLIAEDDELSDDQVNSLIFHPGFSTIENVSDVSGRGVGMDVVRRNIKELGGRLDVQSRRGIGSVFSIRLPLTLAILDGQLVSVDDNVYIFSLPSVVETVQVARDEVKDIVGSGSVYRVRNDYIPVIRLREAFNLGARPGEYDAELLIIVESDGYRMGLFVDDLLEQQQVVIKSLETNYRKVDGLAGATILGDGRVALIVDVPGLMQMLVNTNTIRVNSRTVAA